LILASQSRARQMLLANAGIAFEPIPADIDERACSRFGFRARRDRSLLAREKGACVAQHPGRYVVGADQTLALGSGCSTSPPAARRRATIARACRQYP
jgi:septum formation protein